MVLVNRLEEVVVVDGSPYDLSTSFFPAPCIRRAIARSSSFRLDPWPTWVLRAGNALIERSLFMPHGRQMTIVTWRLVESGGGAGRARLFVKPMISGRDYHALHHENDVLVRDVTIAEGLVTMRPYEGVPAVYLHHNGLFRARPDWYRRFEYPVERERGLDCHEDLFTPGELQLDLVPDVDAVAVFSVEPPGEALQPSELRHEERMRRGALLGACETDFERQLRLAADKFIARRDEHRTVVAGFPWFTDWGRDTFISLPGLALATGWTALGARAPARVGEGRARRAHPQPLPRRGRARVHVGRRAAVVRARGAALRRSRRRRQRGAACTSCRRCAPSSTATSTARGSASASTTTASCTRRRRGCR